MLNKKEKKHYILKTLLLLVLIFLGVIAFKDFTPASQTIEKEIANNAHDL